MSVTEEESIRAAAFRWLREQTELYAGVLPWNLLVRGFEFEGHRITLVGPPGIWKPALFDRIPISIRTGTGGGYDDSPAFGDQLHYRYRRGDPNHRDNEALRAAMRTNTPLIYFKSVEKGAYVPIWPVYIIEDRPEESACIVRTDAAYVLAGLEPNDRLSDLAAEEGGAELQRYVNRVVRQRLHQGAFRARVLRAYRTRCTLCSLRHEELLDAAHIIPDVEEAGVPEVTNGLSLCKIHHAAYDQGIIGIDADYRVAVRRDILNEIDGPMLRYGLQELNDHKIILPPRREHWPNRDRLDERYRRFREAG